MKYQSNFFDPTNPEEDKFVPELEKHYLKTFGFSEEEIHLYKIDLFYIWLDCQELELDAIPLFCRSALSELLEHIKENKPYRAAA